MELIFEHHQIEYNQIPTSEDVFEKINELLSKGYFFSHFIADGIEVFDEPEEYLHLNLDRTLKLEVIAKTEKKFVNDVLVAAEEYLNRIKPEIRRLVNEFNNELTRETWTNFDMLIEGAEWLNNMSIVVGGSNERPESWEILIAISVRLQEELAKLAGFVENKQLQNIGDRIQSGLMPIFVTLEEEIGKAIDLEGTRENLS